MGQTRNGAEGSASIKPEPMMMMLMLMLLHVTPKSLWVRGNWIRSVFDTVHPGNFPGQAAFHPTAPTRG